jgi:hypothetical protein
MDWISRMRARRFMRASIHRTALEDLPDGLEAAWQHSAPQEYPGIRTDAFFFVRAAEGLLRFFDAVRFSSRPCALPSEAADSVWHAWLRHDPIDLERFCRKHFGQVVPHVERGGLGANALAATLMTCRWLEGIAPLGPGLPRLFRLDARLRMPGGHGYWVSHDKVVYARLDKQGRCRRLAELHPELSIPSLLAAGLVDADAVSAHLQARRAAIQASCVYDDSTGPAFASDGNCDSDGGSSDAGCDGGSSCGSSCGSGCGGGGGD